MWKWHLLKLLSEKFKPASITGKDFSVEAIKIAKQKNINNSTFDVQNIYKKDLSHNMYDLILCTEVLEHLEYPEIPLKNIYDMLSTNGSAFITVPNGRLDFFEGHLNFWSINSWRIFITKSLSTLPVNITTGFLDEENSHLYAIIQKNKIQ